MAFPSEAAIVAARTARTAAVWARRPEVRTLELTGPDRARYLNGQVSQDVLRLAPGHGALAVKTSAKGRCEALVRVRVREGAVAVDLLEVVAEPVRAALERYIIMDDCEVRDASAARAVLTVIGPTRHDALAGAGVDVPAALPEHGFVDTAGLTVIADSTLGVPAIELQGPPARVDALAAELSARGVMEAPAEAIEMLRIEEGAPLDGRELDLDTIPLEAHLERAISTTKGCYTGQEVIARATNLGGVQWSLVGLSFAAGDEPVVGAELHAPGSDKPIGSTTSVAWSPLLGGWIALGFVRRTHETPGTSLALASGRAAAVEALPFRR